MVAEKNLGEREGDDEEHRVVLMRSSYELYVEG